VPDNSALDMVSVRQVLGLVNNSEWL